MDVTKALSVFTKLNEAVLDRTKVPELGDEVFHARELNAVERFETLQAAAQGQENGRVNVALWRLMAMTRGVIDPETKEPLFTGDAAGQIIQSGNEVAEAVGEYILEKLSRATPNALFRDREGNDNTGDEDPANSAEDPRTED